MPPKQAQKRTNVFAKHARSVAMKEAKLEIATPPPVEIPPTEDGDGRTFHTEVLWSTSRETQAPNVYSSLLVDNDKIFVQTSKPNTIIEYTLDGVWSKETTLDQGFSGWTFLAGVYVEETPCIAVSIPKDCTIQFRDRSDPSRMVCEFPFKNVKPREVMTLISGSGLAVLDISKDPLQVRWLDCSKNPPKLMKKKHSCLRKDTGCGMLCLIEDGHQEIIVSQSGENELFASRVEGPQIWEVRKRRYQGSKRSFEPGNLATTDRRGHVFVWDPINACVQVFHVYTGRYLGMVGYSVGSGGYVKGMQWCEYRECLVFIEAKNVKLNVVETISAVKVHFL